MWFLFWREVLGFWGRFRFVSIDFIYLVVVVFSVYVVGSVTFIWFLVRCFLG